MSQKNKNILFVLLAFIFMLMLSSCAANPELAAPGVTLSVTPDGQPQQVTSGVQLLVLLTVLIHCANDPDPGYIFYPHRYRPFNAAECDRHAYHSTQPGGHRPIHPSDLLYHVAGLREDQ